MKSYRIERAGALDPDTDQCEEMLASLGERVRGSDLSQQAMERTRLEVRRILTDQSERRRGEHPWPLWEKISLPLGIAAALMIAFSVFLKRADVEPAAGPGEATDPQIARLHGRLAGNVSRFRRDHVRSDSLSVFERRKRSLRSRMMLCSNTIRQELAMNRME